MYHKIAVLGATGNIGTSLTHALLAQGHLVTAVARPSARLMSLQQAGARPAAGDITDADFLTQALSGADAAFLMTPSSWTAPDVLAYIEEVGESVATALQAAGLRHVINLSSLGAELGTAAGTGSGPIRGLRAQENRLNAIAGLHVLHLRPCYFMENLLLDIPLIRHHHAMGTPVRPDLTFPLIATRDIAAYAARAFQQPIQGQRAEVLVGPHDYTLAQAAGLVGAAIGQPTLGYAQVSPEQARRGMVEHGVSENMVTLFHDMLAGMNAGQVLGPVPRDARNTTTTTLEAFATETFAPAYQAGLVTEGH